MIAALIFDFDGVIVDTEPLHYQAFQILLEPLGLGYPWEKYVETYMGYDDREAFREAFHSGGRILDDEQLSRLIHAKARAFEKIISGGVQPYPGVVELIRAASGAVPLALCSGALPSDIEPILDQLGLMHAFDVTVTAADVDVSKPDPASYLLALSRLVTAFPEKGITGSRTLAIEDTPAGIASATGAGIGVLAVTNSYPASDLKGALHIVTTLRDVTLDVLQHLL
jgi:beta-phosphoglucomutase